MIAHAIDDVDDAYDAAERLLGRRAHAEASFDLVVAYRVTAAAGVNEHRPAILRRPGSILDVFDAGDDEPSPRLADRKNSHSEMLIASLQEPMEARNLISSVVFPGTSCNRCASRSFECDARLHQRPVAAARASMRCTLRASMNAAYCSDGFSSRACLEQCVERPQPAVPHHGESGIRSPGQRARSMTKSCGRKGEATV
jgi:hypothetical protein